MECWVAFPLPLTGRLSFSLSLDSSPLRPWLRNSIKSDGCWWRHTERWLWIIAEYWGRTETDRRKQRKRETIAGSEWLMVESISFLQMELLRHWVVKCSTTAIEVLMKMYEIVQTTSGKVKERKKKMTYGFYMKNSLLLLIHIWFFPIQQLKISTHRALLCSRTPQQSRCLWKRSVSNHYGNLKSNMLLLNQGIQVIAIIWVEKK